MFGVIIHFGLYSVYAYDNIYSARRRHVQNGSEWYYGRLIDQNNFRPISGHTFTKAYHEKNYTNKNYFDQNIDITAEKISNWVTLCKNNGANYIILTTKHHEGLCLWNTQTNARKTNMNIIEIFVNECIKQQIDYGFYYSWFEFDKPFTTQYFNNYCTPQLNELQLYNPKYLWFDGQWKITQKSIKISINNLCKSYIEKGIKINDRLGFEADYTYKVFADRFVPTESLNIEWQHINTIGISWGYNKEQKKEDYKTGEQLYTLYTKVKQLNGNFLLNLGPKGNGDICEEELQAINEFGQLIK